MYVTVRLPYYTANLQSCRNDVSGLIQHWVHGPMRKCWNSNIGCINICWFAKIIKCSDAHRMYCSSLDSLKLMFHEVIWNTFVLPYFIMTTFTIPINSHATSLDIRETVHIEEVEISANDQSEAVSLLVKA